jgi:hypothetical protein
MTMHAIEKNRRALAVAALVAAIFTAGMVHSAERTVLGEYITADW